MGSAKKKRTILHRIERGREILRPSARGAREGVLRAALCSATSLEMAVWYPAAVREKDRDNTGLKSWYMPIPSSPNSRESQIRYTKPISRLTIPVAVRMKVPTIRG